MRKYIALSAGIALGCSVLAGTASAQEGIYLGPSLGYYHPDGKRTSNNDRNSATVAGFNVGYRFIDDWAVELSYSSGIFGSDVDKSELSGYYYFGDSAEYEHKLRTYAVTGLSRYQSDELNIVADADDTWQLHVGAGLSKLYENNWEVRGDVRGYYKVRDSNNGTFDKALTFAVLKHFGGTAPAAAPVAAPEPVVAPEPYVAPVPAPAPEPELEPEVRSITLRLNVEFETNSDVIRGIYGTELDAIGNAMKVQKDIELVLEGHTDSQGREDYNQSLSERRAAAVKATLSNKYGISADRISSVGYGESRPVGSNDTVEGRQRNRRVVGEMSYTEVAPK